MHVGPGKSVVGDILSTTTHWTAATHDSSDLLFLLLFLFTSVLLDLKTIFTTTLSDTCQYASAPISATHLFPWTDPAVATTPPIW
mmetsp:Transcript_96005/g.184426  ORF Transcript_96005/g.184426 Transcript_96005/m.184426 type:complete len:85 (-) Transcript_96005:92-346(-)